MLDIAFIRENKELVQKAAKDKNVEVDVDKLLQLNERRRELINLIEESNRERNRLSTLSPSASESKSSSQSSSASPSVSASASVSSSPSEEDIEASRKLKLEAKEPSKELKAVEKEYFDLLYRLPNVPSEDTPVGPDESSNKVLRQEGKKPKLDKAKPHWELGEELDLIDLERAAKVSGSRTAYLKGNLVRLQFALMQFGLDTLTDSVKLKEIASKAKFKVSDKPFVPVLTPDLIKKEVFEKTGRAEPKDDKYWQEADGLVFAGSAEHALAPMHMDEVLKLDDLPLRYVGYSTNFRREAGSYGKDTRGILRLHQFDKLEMESFTTPDQGEDEQKFMLAIQEYLMSKLELPYQVVLICTGDMGKPDFRQIDIETWMPGQDAYRETQTSDYVTDFQARRLNIRYKGEDSKNEFVHMNDATAFSQRPLIAIIENNQTKDGKVEIPKVLQPYMGGVKTL